MSRVIGYKATPTGIAFHQSLYAVRGIRGPVGSGKSVMCCFDLFMKAHTQVAIDGVRWSVFLVGRNTFANLKETTIKTWLTWFPQTQMHWSSPLKGVWEGPCMNDGGATKVRIELLFMAMDSLNIEDDLMSLEISGAWINEATQTQRSVIDGVLGRIGRFKPWPNVEMKDFGLVMDTNSPEETNWWYELEVRNCPNDFEFFVQPPGLLKRTDKSGAMWYEENDGRDYATRGIRAAENVENLPGGFEYYFKQTWMGDTDKIKRLILNEFGSEMDGRPVYPEYNEAAHFTEKEIGFERGMPLLLGTDFGRTPAVVIAQLGASGQLRVLEEILAENISTEQFVEEILRPVLVNRYGFPGTAVMNWADPAGAQGDQVVQMTCIQKYNQYGIRTIPASVPGNRFELRRDCVGEILRQNSARGETALLISGKCPVLRKGFNGGYRYRQFKTQGGGGERFTDGPEKNSYSHPHDALQYLCWGVFKSGMDLSSGLASIGPGGVSRTMIDGAGISLGGLGA